MQLKIENKFSVLYMCPLELVTKNSTASHENPWNRQSMC